MTRDFKFNWEELKNKDIVNIDKMLFFSIMNDHQPFGKMNSFKTRILGVNKDFKLSIYPLFLLDS